MKILKKVMLTVSALALGVLVLSAAGAPSQNKDAPGYHKIDQIKQPKIAIVDFKVCVENSKIGKQEQANFDALKKQMETVLEEKEKTLNDMASKFNDIDYLDSLSPEAETELKRKFRALSQELNNQQTQYYQALSQTNMKVVQKITDNVVKASEEVAKKLKIDIILNEDSAFYTNPDLDISMEIVKILDEMFDKEAKENKEIKPGLPNP